MICNTQVTLEERIPKGTRWTKETLFAANPFSTVLITKRDFQMDTPNSSWYSCMHSGHGCMCA